MELWVGKSEQADRSSPDQLKTSLESTGGHARQQQRHRGQPSLAEGDQERQLEARRISILWSVSSQADCHGQLQFSTRRFLDELVYDQHKSSW